MNIETLKKVLAVTPNTHTVMLKGPHGIGKTEVIRWLAKNVWHQECVEFQASQISDVGDLIGLPRINSETGETEFVPPYWYKKDEHGNPIPVTLFLDEINRGTTLVTNAMMQLGLDHRILNFKLAPGSHVICAINPGDDGNYDVEEFDPAKMDRFVVYNFTPTVGEWLDWAIDSGVNSIVTGYISQYSSDLDPYSNANASKTASKSFDGILPSRRTWVHFANFLDKAMDEGLLEGKDGLGILQESCAGYVGQAIAAKFKTYFAQHGTGMDAKALMESKNFEKDYAKKIKDLCKKSKIEAVQLGNSVCTYLHENEGKFGTPEKPTELAKKYADNYYYFLSNLTKEIQVEVYTNAVDVAHTKEQKWTKLMGKACSIRVKDEHGIEKNALKELYISIVDVHNEYAEDK